MLPLENFGYQADTLSSELAGTGNSETFVSLQNYSFLCFVLFAKLKISYFALLPTIYNNYIIVFN